MNLIPWDTGLEYHHISLLEGSESGLHVTMILSHATVYKVSTTSPLNTVAVIVKVPLEEGHLLRKWSPQGIFQVSSNLVVSHEALVEAHRGKSK